ncbi:hypothetical protein PIROE2DRAFT_14250 [Piromyces sp. E2]|nr:hypothetical protein PIROE2DRAFT_14250 [Piromyces sp. E2]|eukprot:OUM60059.1 hypothetical protein PIROE2DRAFT_14250 [Piromyces sp. E2]
MNNYNLNKYNLMNDTIQTSDIKCGIRIAREVTMLISLQSVIIIITKLQFDQGFQDIVKKECPQVKAVIRVQSISTTLEDGHVIKPKNLEELTNITNEVIPEGIGKAFASTQKVSLKIQEEESRKVIKLYVSLEQ